MNYGTLKEIVKDYLEVDETTFNDNISQFVENMEDDVYGKVQITDLRKNSTTTLTPSTPYVQTPSDYLSPYSLAVIDSGSYSFLLPKDVNFMREAFPSATTTGLPRFYSHFDDDTFIIAPTPDAAYSLELHYYHRPASLSTSDTTTTWLSENAENVVVFGTILQGYIFLKGDQDVINQYQKRYDEAISNLLVVHEGRTRKDTYRTADRRVPT